MAPPPELMVVLPVYNEQASIERVVVEWMDALARCTSHFVLFAIDDGSHDQTPALLRRLAGGHGERMEMISRPNRGHGQTCLEGYRLAAARGIPHVLQIDSDGQSDPQYFHQFWSRRDEFDVVYGTRVRRDDGWRRVLASRILRALLLMMAGVECRDANVPYRLMRTSAVARAVDKIPPDFFLANVALATLLRRDPKIRHHYVPIRFRERFGGEPVVPLSAFARRAMELACQLRQLLRDSKMQEKIKI